MVVLEAERAPVSDVDPFCREFFENPFPAHEELREAGPVVRLSRYDVWAVARYAEVHAILNDWQTSCSSRGVGLTDFAKEQPWRPKSLVLETDPPLHDKTRRVLNRVLSASAMTRLRERFAQKADALIDELVERGSVDAIADLAEAYPLTVFPDAMGMPRENRHFLLPYGNMVSTRLARGTSSSRRRSRMPRRYWPGCSARCSGTPLPPEALGRQSTPQATPAS
jgi:cytochrome P450